MHCTSKSIILSAVAFFAVVHMVATPAVAEDEALFGLSIADLSNIKVTSISKVEENAFQAPVPIYVLTQDDIKRSGATSIPEALRMVPGVQVARISANKWAISARGFNDQLANKLLVLIDGRSVYTNHFSGVYWDVQDTLLEDVDRIEVIRGPGGSVWGANAVNGVINIITKHSRNTQGTYASVGGGSSEGVFTEARYGGMWGDSGSYRGYAKYADHQNFHELDGDNAFDDWNIGQGGFRADWDKNPQESFTIQGDAYGGKENEDRVLLLPSLTFPYVSPQSDVDGGKVSGANLMFKWDNAISTTSKTHFQAYVDNTHRNYSYLGQEQDTFDLDFQHQWTPISRHQFTWGLGFRYIYQSIDESQYFDQWNSHRYDSLYSAFLQDKIAVIPDKLDAYLGSKVEYNDYTGVEYQPSARLAWLISSRQTAWAAVSRAVRTPNFSENSFNTIVGTAQPGIFGAGTPAGYIKWEGNPALESEELKAYELGYRIRPNHTMSFDIAAYYNDFNNLVTTEPVAVFPQPDTALFLQFQNRASGEVYGIEFTSTFDASNNWRLVSSYTLSKMALHRDAGSLDTLEEPLEGKTARNKVSVNSYWNITQTVMLDNGVYFTDSLPSASVPAYIRFDSRLAWKMRQDMELGLVGQNLFDNRHQEFSESLLSSPTEVPRSVWGYMTWHF